MFKVGDKVRIISTPYSKKANDYYLNKRGKITKICGRQLFPYTVDIPNYMGVCSETCWRGDELEIVAENEFFDRVLNERERQKNFWGNKVHGGHAWVSILGEEFGEFCKAVNGGYFSGAEDELVQIAAVAMAAYEQSKAGSILFPDWTYKDSEIEYWRNRYQTLRDSIDELMDEEN